MENKIDLKNLTPEQKKKGIVFGVMGVIVIGMIIFASSSSDSSSDTVDDFATPKSEKELYNSKTEALSNSKKNQPQTASNLEDLYATKSTISEQNSEVEEVNVDLITSAINNSNSNSYSSSTGGRSNSVKSTPSNKHNVYGSYDMWQMSDPDKSSNNNKVIKITKNTSNEIEAPEPKTYKVITEAPVYSEPQTKTYSAPTKTKVQQDTKQIKAKLITKGSILNGETISFITKENANVSGVRIPKGTVISGVSNFSGQRLNVKFETVNVKGKIHKINLTMYGLDGLMGLAVSGQSSTKAGQDAAYRSGTNVLGNGVVGGVIRAVSDGVKSKQDNSITLGKDIDVLLINEL